MRVSIIIPVLNKLEFTRQCLDRIWRNTGDTIPYEIIVIDNGSSDGTARWFTGPTVFPRSVRYHRNPENLGFAKANNIGAGLARGEYLLFLNNDTLVQPGWLSEMLRVATSDRAVGVVGIKQLFPYTNVVYHTGVVFASGGIPQHLYPHLDASIPHVNREREYQAVTGACLLIDRELFEACGRFDEAYVNGYEDTDLCLQVARRGRKIVCCTSAHIYHYGQISEGRTAADDQNAKLFTQKWGAHVKIDQDEYLARDRFDFGPAVPPARPQVRSLSEECIYLADDLQRGSAQTWVNAELALSLRDRGVPVFVNGTGLSPTLPAAVSARLRPLVLSERPTGGVQIKWSHYWRQHLNLELAGDVNLEFFVINYLFSEPIRDPWDRWLQCVRQNHHAKLPVSDFCRSVLLQLGLSAGECHVLHHGYSREVSDVEPPRRRDSTFRFLTVTNSHDLERYNTRAVIDAFDAVFDPRDEVALVIKDYGASSGDTTLRDTLAKRRGMARVELLDDFTTKRELIRLYKSCDTYVSAHRGEGFGMKILDAMACGLPVITPLFGGPTAYCRSDNCFPVAFTLVPLGRCLDSRSLQITNAPMWADVDRQSLGEQMRRVFQDRSASDGIGQRARAAVLDEFSWDRAADRLLTIISDVRARRSPMTSLKRGTLSPSVERSPYWLGLRVSVVVPTRDRKAKLLACLAALERQSILPQEFEVVVVDDGSTDGTREAVDAYRVPFRLRYVRQEGAGPGAARNLGIQEADGELVLFIGDDIYADEHLLEEHLLAHASNPDQGAAVLGHIEWPDATKPNEVMEYVCGDAMLQFAYRYIPTAPMLDHRFFYTSNISLKRQFLLDAAGAGVRFDPCFRHAAFEDSELAYRLMPRGLEIRYAPRARAVHDHWLDLDSFAAREFRAGEMAVVFYRKHPGQDEHLDVEWVADLVRPADALVSDPPFLQHLDAFDAQTDTLLRGLAGSLEELLAMNQRPGSDAVAGLSPERLRAGLHNVLKAIFDVQRTRGKVREWFSGVDDHRRIRAAQVLATVLRKIEFLNLTADRSGMLGSAPINNELLEGLRARVGTLDGMAVGAGSPPDRRRTLRAVRRLLAWPGVARRLLQADRFIQSRLLTTTGGPWLERYRRARSHIRRIVR